MQDNKLLCLYFRDITSSKPLSIEEEAKLSRQIHGGDREARDRLVSANLRFVVHLAREYQNCGVPLTDLISAGNLGLIKAAERFDETRGFKFISYAASWVRNCILEALSQHVWLVRLPHNRIGLLRKISRISRDMTQTDGDKPELETIAEELDVGVEIIRDTLVRAQEVWSIDAAFQGEDGEDLLSALAVDEEQSPEAQIVRASVRARMMWVLDTLDEREAEVLRLYFGLDDDDPLTLEEIGNRMHLTRERIRQIRDRAINRLRHPRLRMHLESLRESV